MNIGSVYHRLERLKSRDSLVWACRGPKQQFARSCLLYLELSQECRNLAYNSFVSVAHTCGYKLANDGHDTRSLQAYLGHRNIQNTTRYTALAQDRFKGFWTD
jgi:site-specific recombinase XerD